MSRRAKDRMTRTGRWLALSLILGAVGSAAFVYLRWVYREHRYDKLIAEIATKYGVDKALVKAVIRRESKFDPFVYGRAGEIGLMQVTAPAGEEWARAVGRRDFGKDLLWSERVNIEAGTWYLARGLRRWQGMDDPIPFALAEYNAGLGRVRQWLPRGGQTTAREFMDTIGIASVRAYIGAVTEYYEHYRATEKP